MTLRYASAMKEAGVRILTAPNGGFGDPALIDRFIAEGRTDMVAMGRAFIAEPEYVPKLLSGTPLTPCIRCGRCHGSIDDCVAVCSVNPQVGLEHRLSHMRSPVQRQKRVAIVGRGPAGMEAAIVCADRGHAVTLYEKETVLGGQLRHADYTTFKWAVRDYTDKILNNETYPYICALFKYCIYEGPFALDVQRYFTAFNDIQTEAVERWEANRDEDWNMPSGVTLTTEETETRSNIANEIGAYCSEMVLKFIVGDLEVNDGNWNTFISGMEDLGSNEVVEITQAALDRYYAE